MCDHAAQWDGLAMSEVHYFQRKTKINRANHFSLREWDIVVVELKFKRTRNKIRNRPLLRLEECARHVW